MKLRQPKTEVFRWPALKGSEIKAVLEGSSAYLELALRRSLPLATLDEGLRRAGSSEKVAL